MSAGTGTPVIGDTILPSSLVVPILAATTADATAGSTGTGTVPGLNNAMTMIGIVVLLLTIWAPARPAAASVRTVAHAAGKTRVLMTTTSGAGKCRGFART